MHRAPKLRPLLAHQVPALDYARSVAHPAIWMQMRLGKTTVCIRCVHEYGIRTRALVIAPNSALGDWERELGREGVPPDEIVRLAGTRTVRLRRLYSERARWFLLNKEGWQVVPEVAGAARCETCRGRGKVKASDVTTVVNQRDNEFDISISRESKWGNPYKITATRTREESIDQYRQYFLRTNLTHDLNELWGKILGCWCKPLACHGDILIEVMDAELPRRVCIPCRGKGSIPETYKAPSFDTVVLDESTFIKNPNARVSQFMLSHFRDVSHRWSMTGLPAPEGQLGLWNQLAWLDGKALGCKSFWGYSAKYFTEGDGGFEPLKGSGEKINRLVAARAYVMTRKDAGVEFFVARKRCEVELPPRLKRAYRAAEREFILELDGQEIKRTMYAGTRWHWMRQICGGFVDGELVWRGKIDLLLEFLQGELAGEKAVVWFRYNPELHAVSEALSDAGVSCSAIWGDVKPTRRAELVECWRADGFRILLAQMAALDKGVDLSAGDTGIYYSTHASGEMRQQTEDRIGHPQKKTPLLLVDLVVPRTVDEDVVDELGVKKWRSDSDMMRAVALRMQRRSA